MNIIIGAANINDIDSHKYVFQMTGVIKIYDLYNYNNMEMVYVQLYKFLIVVIGGSHCHGIQSNEIIGKI